MRANLFINDDYWKSIDISSTADWTRPISIAWHVPIKGYITKEYAETFMGLKFHEMVFEFCRRRSHSECDYSLVRIGDVGRDPA